MFYEREKLQRKACYLKSLNIFEYKKSENKKKNGEKWRENQNMNNQKKF